MKLDIWSAYNLIYICDSDEWKIIFYTQYDYFKYTVMLFKLVNTSATFQVYINQTLWDILDVYIIVYLNDILIYSEDDKSHMVHVYNVLEWPLYYKLYAKLKKCIF